jgi:hypothetical protein
LTARDATGLTYDDKGNLTGNLAREQTYQWDYENRMRLLIKSGTIINLHIVNSVNDLYEVMAYAAEARSTAFGATGGVSGMDQNVNLRSIWPSDMTGNNYADHFWHSAEFRGDSTQQWNYWYTLLRSATVGFGINNE